MKNLNKSQRPEINRRRRRGNNDRSKQSIGTIVVNATQVICRVIFAFR
jgi:hypothetical protein